MSDTWRDESDGMIVADLPRDRPSTGLTVQATCKNLQRAKLKRDKELVLCQMWLGVALARQHRDQL